MLGFLKLAGSRGYSAFRGLHKGVGGPNFGAWGRLGFRVEGLRFRGLKPKQWP